jgi:polar amino acid transport system substrate-binding protein
VPRSLLLTAAIASASVLVLAGCGSAAENASPEKISAAPLTAEAAIKPAANCKDGLPPVASLAPDGITTDSSTWPKGSAMAAIKAKNRLVVGTSGDVLLWGARNPDTGDLEGFDIDVLKEVADALGVGITYKVINYGDRLKDLQNGSVDLVAHTMTINCARWQGSDGQPNAINFSSEYYQAGQKLLRRSDSDFTKIEQFAGQSICVPKDSTNEELVTGINQALEKAGKTPVKVEALPVIGDCLVKFQEGEVVAVTGDDTVLAGFAKQDPYAEVVGEPISSEPYGLGVKADAPEFARFVNFVLERMRNDGTLRTIYRNTMGTAIEGPAPTVPQPKYGRDISKLDRP